jgi:hypothetical protein
MCDYGLKRKRHNITLKRDAPYRGGFEGLLFFWLRWLGQSSVKGAPLSSTLGLLTVTLTGIPKYFSARARIFSMSSPIAAKYLPRGLFVVSFGLSESRPFGSVLHSISISMFYLQEEI